MLVVVLLQDRIAEHVGRLSRGDRSLATELLNDPVGAPFWSAEELANRAGVSQATAVRLARKLGFDGYPGMRTAMQQELREHGALSARVSRRLDAGDGILGDLVRREQRLLGDLHALVSESELTEAARMVASARRIVIVANGHATALSELLSRRLRRLGVHVVAATGSRRDLAEAVFDIDARDLLIVVALRRPPSAYESLMALAASAGALTIAIADSAGALLAPAPQLLLAASRGDDGDYQTLVVPMLMVEAVTLALARLDRHAADRLDRLESTINALATGRSPKGPS